MCCAHRADFLYFYLKDKMLHQVCSPLQHCTLHGSPVLGALLLLRYRSMDARHLFDRMPPKR
uniref:Uncharacterized protein n=1 Tax=Arundo donax TaxID=35708 RepID=A0A0A9DR91_ARUDO